MSSFTKRDNWFLNYESLRDLNYRKSFLLKEDFQDQSVIDIGCNSGQMCRYASDLGATKVLGIEYDKTAIKEAIQKNEKYNNIDYLIDDIDNYMLYTNLHNFDTGLLLSVIGTCELENRYGLLAKISSKILKTMYIEGHHTVFRRNELFKAILDYTTFTSIEYLGLTYDNDESQQNNKSRDIFRCSRKIYSHEETMNKIIDMLDNENKIIAIQGHGGVGKTTLRCKLIKFLNKNTAFKFDNNVIDNENSYTYVQSLDGSLCILDDVANANIEELQKKHKFILYFDYRVLEYLKNINIDSLFIFNYNIKHRFETRPQYREHRCYPIKQFIKNIYHIEAV